MGKQTVVVNILANTSGFRRGIDHVTGALGTLTSTATKTVGALGRRTRSNEGHRALDEDRGSAGETARARR